MGVTTRADEQIDEVRGLVRQAISLLGDVVIDECWGWENFSKEFQSGLSDALSDLMSARSKLK